MLPIFLIDDPDKEQEIASMPGVKRMGINAAINFLDPLIKIGLKSVLLFAVTAAQKVGTCHFATTEMVQYLHHWE